MTKFRRKHNAKSLEEAKALIRSGWPMRHDYIGVRLGLRTIVRHARAVRDRAAAEPRKP